MPVRREAANRVTIYCWHQRQCSVVGVRLGQCRHISMSKLGSIITSVLPVATMLICQRACICVGVCVWVLQCEETCLHALRFVSALRLSPVSLALLLQGFPRKCVPNAQCDDVVNSVREMGIDCKLLVLAWLPGTHKQWGISPPKVTRPGCSVCACVPGSCVHPLRTLLP